MIPNVNGVHACIEISWKKLQKTENNSNLLGIDTVD